MPWGTIILVGAGVFVFYIGFLLWGRLKIELLHDDRMGRVKEENKKPFCRMMGAGISIIGVGILLCPLINRITEPSMGWISFLAGMVIGLFLVRIAGQKYNR